MDRWLSMDRFEWASNRARILGRSGNAMDTLNGAIATSAIAVTPREMGARYPSVFVRIARAIITRMGTRLASAVAQDLTMGLKLRRSKAERGAFQGGSDGRYEL